MLRDSRNVWKNVEMVLEEELGREKMVGQGLKGICFSSEWRSVEVANWLFIKQNNFVS